MLEQSVLIVASSFNIMTKSVRVENACTSSYGVIVEVWDKGGQVPDGLGGFNQLPDVLVKTVELNHPTTMTGSDVYITNTRYLVVKEKAQ